MTKPESALTLETVTFDVTTMAHWMPASKQSLRDVAGVRSLIDAKLEWGLRRRLAKQVIAGDGIGANLLGIANTAGIGHVDRSGADAASLIEDIYDGVVTIGDAYGEAPNVCFVVPRRLQAAALRPRHRTDASADGTAFSEVETGGFIFGTPRSGQPDRGRGLPRAAELRPAGRDERHGRLARVRRVDARGHQHRASSDSHDTYFVENLVAILAEFAAAAGAMETVAFCEISAAG